MITRIVKVVDCNQCQYCYSYPNAPLPHHRLIISQYQYIYHPENKINCQKCQHCKKSPECPFPCLSGMIECLFILSTRIQCFYFSCIDNSHDAKGQATKTSYQNGFYQPRLRHNIFIQLLAVLVVSKLVNQIILVLAWQVSNL